MGREGSDAAQFWGSGLELSRALLSAFLCGEGAGRGAGWRSPNTAPIVTAPAWLWMEQGDVIPHGGHGLPTEPWWTGVGWSCGAGGLSQAAEHRETLCEWGQRCLCARFGLSRPTLSPAAAALGCKQRSEQQLVWLHVPHQQLRSHRPLGCRHLCLQSPAVRALEKGEVF